MLNSCSCYIVVQSLFSCQSLLASKCTGWQSLLVSKCTGCQSLLVSKCTVCQSLLVSKCTGCQSLLVSKCINFRSVYKLSKFIICQRILVFKVFMFSMCICFQSVSVYEFLSL